MCCACVMFEMINQSGREILFIFVHFIAFLYKKPLCALRTLIVFLSFHLDVNELYEFISGIFCYF